VKTPPSSYRSIFSGGAIGLRIPITGFPHAMRSPPVVKRTPNAPSHCAERSRAVAASMSALTAATVWASTSVRIVASISSRTDSARGS